MSSETKRIIIDELAGCIDIPESAYDKAVARYRDLGEWFSRPESACSKFDPHIYPQGSFRLGTVTNGDEYDLDFGCRLRKGVTKQSHTQEELKELVRIDMEAHRQARRIEQRLEEKTRCWRLKYKDDLSFHLDGVPSIPEESTQRKLLQESMVKYGSDDALAKTVVQFSGSITDNQLSNYKKIDPKWRVSNSEGYALWFEWRMKLEKRLVESLSRVKAAQVDDLPARKWKSPLQRSIQILKCHRNLMFVDNPDSQPISIIITTLAAQAYQGESDVNDALARILSSIESFIRQEKPLIPNPVNPDEDFADKWYDSKYSHLDLQRNFYNWIKQARSDFDVIAKSRDPDFIHEQAMEKFGARLDLDKLKIVVGTGSPAISIQPKKHRIVETPARPWCNG